MSAIHRALVAIGATCACFCLAEAQAARFDFAGDIAFHNDVVEISFELLRDATDVRVWTDSYGGPASQGINFDPITAVWDMSAGGRLVDSNDDDGTIAPGQHDYDSGLVFTRLKAGRYLFTIATFHNWNNGDWLSQGSNYDAEAPIALAAWDQPSNHVGMGPHWSVHLAGVDAATPPIPEPASSLLALAGLAAVGLVARHSAVARH